MTITELASERPDQESKSLNLPYAPSWVDRFLMWVEQLPMPPWLFYLIVLVVGSLIEHVVRWMEGSLAVGSIDKALAAEAPFLVFAPLALHYLNATARHALREFRPALQIDDAQYALLEYELTTVPARAAWIASIVSVALASLSLISTPGAFGISSETSIATTLLIVLLLILQAPFYLVFIYHTVRQLRLVSSIYAMVKQINLFRLFPVYAFSSLTARTGLAIIFLVYYTYFFFYDLNVRGATPGILGTASLMIVFFPVALACGVLPLTGMHRRLVEEKSRLLAETNRRTEQTLAAMHQRVDEGEYHQVDGMQKALVALQAEHQIIDKISTWPWRTETLRSFLSTISLPIILYLISRFLGRLVGL